MALNHEQTTAVYDVLSMLMVKCKEDPSEENQNRYHGALLMAQAIYQNTPVQRIEDRVEKYARRTGMLW